MGREKCRVRHMRRVCTRAVIATLILILTRTRPVAAHQPVIVESPPVVIRDPEVSRAFYAILEGEPHRYIIEASDSFELYVGLLVPLSSNPDGRYSADILRTTGEDAQLVATLDGASAAWRSWREEFAGDMYLEGPEFRLKGAPAGRYVIEVYGQENEGRYVLSMGRREVFGPSALRSAFTVLPTLKLEFFQVSPLSLLASVMGVILVFGLAVGEAALMLVWALLRRALWTTPLGLSLGARALVGAVGIALLLLGVHLWSWPLMSLASFPFYVAASRLGVLQHLAGV